MRAAWYVQQGPARDVLTVGLQPKPVPDRGEVRVRVHASGVNPTDTYARGGTRGGPMRTDLVVPHQDGAGVVDAVGAGVSDEWLGRRVWIHMARREGASGTAAEWVAVPRDHVAELPAEYGFEIGACLGIPWLTANLAVSAVGPIEGRDVLITGGSGAVAFYATQVATRLGARVTATVGDPARAELVAGAGAATVVDRTSADVSDRLVAATGGRGFDRVIESAFSANGQSYGSLLRPRAKIVVYGTRERAVELDVSAALRGQWQVRFVYAYSMARAARQNAADRLLAWEAEQALQHLPLRVYPLEAIAAAHEQVETGRGGTRTVVDPDS